MTPSVQRARLRPVVWRALLATLAVGALAAAILVCDLVDRPVWKAATTPPPEQRCAVTEYYYDMAPFVREVLWCGTVPADWALFGGTRVPEDVKRWPVVR